MGTAQNENHKTMKIQSDVVEILVESFWEQTGKGNCKNLAKLFVPFKTFVVSYFQVACLG